MGGRQKVGGSEGRMVGWSKGRKVGRSEGRRVRGSEGQRVRHFVLVAAGFSPGQLI